ncbi:MAG TPA: ATP-binding protein [Gemmatimonadaceae bacterium]|nr:ATP-binding protein [Gemmatimonadaceae bacterium]
MPAFRIAPPRTVAVRYGGAVVIAGLGFVAALAMRPAHVQTNLPFVAAVAVSAWYGGRGPGLLTSILAVLAIAFFIGLPSQATGAVPGVAHAVYLAVFLLVAFIIGATTESLRVARAAAEAAATRATRLQEVTAALSQASTEREVTAVVLDSGFAVIQGACGCLARVDGNRFEVIGATGFAPDVEARVRALTLDDPTPLTLAVTSGEPVWLRSAEELRRRFPRAYECFGVLGETQAHAGVPLRHGGEIVGGIAVSFTGPTALGAADQAFTLLVAQAAADAMFRARGYDAERGARREAEMRAQARADVLGIVAHDLRNPLNLISSSSTLLLEQDDLPPAQRRKMLEINQRAVRQMNRLIADLLDATRLQAGRLTLDVAELDARTLVRETDETLRPTAAERRVELRSEPPEQECAIRADEGRLLQVLGNLVGNALKFTPPGGHVTLSARPNGSEVVFSVVDDGPGIPLEHQPRLFDGFWQGRDGDRRGVGLGLTITKGIVEAHGGRIWLESTVGVGSTFSFAIPAAPNRHRAEPGPGDLPDGGAARKVVTA